MTNIKEMWTRLQDRLREQAQLRQTVKELSKLSDYQLRDMGISRSMIYEVAQRGSDRG